MENLTVNDEDDEGDTDGEIAGKYPFLDEGKTRERFQDIEKASGCSQEEAIINSQQMINDIKKAAQYPRSKVPEDRSPDDILDVIQELDDDLEND